NGILVGFVDAQGIGKRTQLVKYIWEEIARALHTIISKLGESLDAKRVKAEIERWLQQDPRRRIIVLIDEADDFV
ncbi:hypothetical protein, partial [Klebsiella pneumoniae]|uniref:hypothetical protein n=1 Tax=Klebsiella pneumoniae TaxID=573 RepID=UPI0013D496D0